MPFVNSNHRHLLSLAAMTALCTCAAGARAQSSPDEWLDRMSGVIDSIDYEGTVIRTGNGQTEALKIVHTIIDGVVREKLVTQEGNGLEIIRIGDEVHCILPDQKTVLIEDWNNQSTLFTALPDSELRYSSAYDLSLVREDRVAGRRAVMLAIRPHDEFRFSHRIWLDRETSFPLKTEMLGVDGQLIEQIKFADIRIDSGISGEALQPSMSLEDFSWYAEPARYEASDVETDWECVDLPPGFQAVSTSSKRMKGSAAPVTHIVYHDGMAKVSVFIAKRSDADMVEWANVGASNSYSAQLGDYQVTAVGEVPAGTVRRIAMAMQQR